MKSIFQQDIEKVSKKIPVDKFNNKSILVTGATGLIGGTVAKMLLANKSLNCNIYLMSRNLDKLKKIYDAYQLDDRLFLLQHDVSKPLTFDFDFNYIIDCASLGNPRAFRENPVDVITANVLGVNNLLSYGKTHGIDKFVYVSSGEVYGDGNGSDFVEDYSGYVDLSNVRSCYPLSKRAAESLCIAYSVQYGLDVTIARPCHIYGPNYLESDDRAYAQFFRNASCHKDIILKSEGKQVRSWLYVVDCAFALIFILTNGKNGEAYNVAPIAETLSIKELASLIAQIGGVELKLDIDELSVRNAVVSRGVLDSSKLKRIGWINEFDIQIGVEHSLTTLRSSVISAQ